MGGWHLNITFFLFAGSISDRAEKVVPLKKPTTYVLRTLGLRCGTRAHGAHVAQDAAAAKKMFGIPLTSVEDVKRFARENTSSFLQFAHNKKTGQFFGKTCKGWGVLLAWTFTSSFLSQCRPNSRLFSRLLLDSGSSVCSSLVHLSFHHTRAWERCTTYQLWPLCLPKLSQCKNRSKPPA